MSDTIHISTNAETVLRDFAKLPKDLQEGVRKGLKRALLLIEDAVKRRAELRLSGSRSGLASRLTSYVDASFGVIEGVIGFRKTKHFPYELSQEFGAKAKPGKAMVVPVSDRAKRMAARGEGPRDMSDVQLFIPRGRHVLAALTPGRRSIGLEVHYILIKSLRPRLRFRENVIGNLDIVSREVEAGAKEGVA